MPEGIIITRSMLKDIIRIREKFDSLVETLEIMNNKELREGIGRSRKNAKEGKIKKLEKLDDMDAW